MSVPEDRQLVNRPVPITAQEFDRRAEEGEDLDDYLDWDNAASVEPDELSPGQKLAMEADAWGKPSKDASEVLTPLSIALPSWAFDLLRQDAARKGISPEHWAQLIVLQRMDKLRVAS